MFILVYFFFFKQKTAYEMRISDWSSDVCSSDLVTPDTLIDTNPGWMPNGRYRTTDTRNHGVLTVTGVITKSSNVGVSKIVAKLDDKDFYEFLRRFGYGEST